MSGHSKWANIKHRKAAQDAKRGNLFQKLVKAIIIAAKDGGGDPAMNVRLKAAIDRAKAASVPASNIDRAIQRGTGEIEGAMYEELTYEVYGVEGVALVVSVLTDNRNRTTPEIRAMLEHNGGTMGTSGSVMWMFDRKGQITIEGKVDEDELLNAALEAGADDVEVEEDSALVTTDPASLSDVAESLKKAGYNVTEAEQPLVPKTTVTISEVNKARKLMKLIDLLEGHDDVQDVYANYEFPDDVQEALDAEE